MRALGEELRAKQVALVELEAVMNRPHHEVEVQCAPETVEVAVDSRPLDEVAQAYHDEIARLRSDRCVFPRDSSRELEAAGE
jgi:hypothetical protein